MTPAITARVDALRRDSLSGSVEITRQAAGVLLLLAEGDPAEFRRMLIDSCRGLVAAQPQMAPVFRLANEVLLRAFDPAAAIACCHSFLAGLRDSADRIAAVAAGHLPAGVTVLTHSAGETVERALAAVHAAGKLREVICTESRPRCEGTLLAARLAAQGIRTTLLIDAAIAGALARADCAMTGADAVSDEGITNKVGTLALARLCQAAAKPLYILSGWQKFLPPGRSLPPEPVRDPRELAPALPPGVTVFNSYFEITPASLVTGLVTEEGVLHPAAIDRRRALIEVHPALAQDQN